MGLRRLSTAEGPGPNSTKIVLSPNPRRPNGATKVPTREPDQTQKTPLENNDLRIYQHDQTLN